MKSSHRKTFLLLSIVSMFAPVVGIAQPGQTGNASVSAPVSAPSSAGAPSKKEMLDARGRKITVVNFDDALIEGKARGPDGFILRSRQSGTFRSILELRRDFRAEVRGSGVATVPVVPSVP